MSQCGKSPSRLGYFFLAILWRHIVTMAILIYLLNNITWLLSIMYIQYKHYCFKNALKWERKCLKTKWNCTYPVNSCKRWFSYSTTHITWYCLSCVYKRVSLEYSTAWNAKNSMQLVGFTGLVLIGLMNHRNYWNIVVLFHYFLLVRTKNIRQNHHYRVFLFSKTL